MQQFSGIVIQHDVNAPGNTRQRIRLACHWQEKEFDWRDESKTNLMADPTETVPFELRLTFP